MSMEFSRTRRFALASIALTFAALLFRSQLATALVIRGDDYLYRGDQVQAMERYRRALRLAPSVAADRYIFIALQMQTAQSLRDGLRVATAYLNARPHDATIHADRALCYLHIRRYTRAEADFEEAGRESQSAAYYVFAGWSARHAGYRQIARRLWKKALRFQPHYAPALIALAERKP